ncbi:MAG: HIT domain-containing protein [Thaumarchaeota archaeon]|nr:HIT domain-containing protein [Nitrososphaerota archaeon]
MDCIFCKIVDGTIPARIILQSDKSLAFLDVFPLTNGHSLVIPKNHYEKVQQMPPDENSDLFRLVQKVTEKIEALTDAELIAIHNGKESGQEIPHVHVHIIPRSARDGAGAVHSMFRNRPKLSDKEFDDILTKIKG